MKEETKGAPLTAEALAEMKARLAGNGPWHLWDRGIGWEVHHGEMPAESIGLNGRDKSHDHCDSIVDGMRETFDGEGRAAFIAFAPTDMAALIAEVERLQGENADLIKAFGRREHVAKFREDGFSLEHPFRCRKTGMLDCLVNAACQREQTMPPNVIAGEEYEVSSDAEGFLVVGGKLEASDGRD